MHSTHVVCHCSARIKYMKPSFPPRIFEQKLVIHRQQNDIKSLWQPVGYARANWYIFLCWPFPMSLFKQKTYTSADDCNGTIDTLAKCLIEYEQRWFFSWRIISFVKTRQRKGAMLWSRVTRVFWGLRRMSALMKTDSVKDLSLYQTESDSSLSPGRHSNRGLSFEVVPQGL